MAKPFLISELLHQVGRCLGQEQQEIPREKAQVAQVVGRQGCFGG
ncbi:MAG: hypothetical protein WC256_11985 [Desulfurivibrionaceae bacterium]